MAFERLERGDERLNLLIPQYYASSISEFFAGETQIKDDAQIEFWDRIKQYRGLEKIFYIEAMAQLKDVLFHRLVLRHDHIHLPYDYHASVIIPAVRHFPDQDPSNTELKLIDPTGEIAVRLPSLTERFAARAAGWGDVPHKVWKNESWCSDVEIGCSYHDIDQTHDYVLNDVDRIPVPLTQEEFEDNRGFNGQLAPEPGS